MVYYVLLKTKNINLERYYLNLEVAFGGQQFR